MSVFIVLSFIGVLVSLSASFEFTLNELASGSLAVAGLLLYGAELLKNRKKQKDSAQLYTIQSAEESQNSKRLYEEKIQLSDSLAKSKHHADTQENIINELSEKCICITKGSDITQKLTQIVQEKTEESTLEFTHRVYQVLEISEQLNRTIQQVLGALSSEHEDSLTQDVLLLENEQHKIETLIDDFVEIRSGYTVEVEKIKDDLGSIGEFVGVISELADKTNILAINASIEAARAGQAGDGFAVIGSEIQKLSHSSKEIAEQINATIQSSVQSVSASVEQYSARISTAVNRLEQSGAAYAALIKKLNPQIAELSNIVETSNELSSRVHDNVDEITVHLQYQDRIKQILGHLLQILQDIGVDAAMAVKTHGERLSKDEHELYTEMVEKASRHFTCDEEYAAFGLGGTINQNDENGSEAAPDKEPEFAGNVELF
jgi:methyl-accepting chemotaxis protein